VQLLSDLKPATIITITGPGGMGKTALASEALHRLTNNGAQLPEIFPDGILTYSFYGKPEVALALEFILRQYGHEAKPTPEEAATTLFSRLEAILVLDSAEEADHLDSIIDIHGRTCLLITSRSRGDIHQTHHPLPPLETNESQTLLNSWAANCIDDPASAEQISNLVGDLPLAVRLAGKYMLEHQEPASSYLQWLQSTPLEALDHGDPRKESVNILLEKSLTQVSESSRQALSVIGTLALAPFHLDFISIGLDLDDLGTQSALSDLIKYGLLIRSQDWYTLSHPMIHTYTSQNLVPPENSLNRLTMAFSQLVETQNQEGASGHKILDLIRTHFISNLQTASIHELWDLVDYFAIIAYEYFEIQGFSTERIQTAELGLKAVQKQGNRRAESNWISCLGSTYRDLGHVKRAIEFHKRALQISQEIGDRIGESTNLGNLGIAYSDLGQEDQAIENYQKSLDIAKDIDDRNVECAQLVNLGSSYLNLGKVERAIEYYEKALEFTNEIGDQRGKATVFSNLGLAYSNLGQVARAIGYFKKALEISKEIGARKNESTDLSNLGLAYISLGQTDIAIEYFQKTLEITQEIADRRGEGSSFGNLGLAFSALGQEEPAIEYHEKALEIAQDIGDRRMEGNSLGNLGQSSYFLGHLDQANEYFQKALEIVQEIGDRRREGGFNGGLGLVYSALGQVERATEYYQKALEIAQEIGDRQNEGVWLGNLGNAYRSTEQTERAIEFYKDALRIAQDIGDQRAEGAHLGNLGLALGDLGHMERSIDYYGKALKIAQEIGDRRAEGNHLTNMGLAYRTLNQLERARGYLTRSFAILNEIKSPDANLVQLWLNILEDEG
jgi:tetratricopeptide (TPR) repeat protein